jgi:D-alanine-D-alanine ligase
MFDSVLILYNLPKSQSVVSEGPLTSSIAATATGSKSRRDTGSSSWQESDAGVLIEVDSVLAALGRLGIPCRAVGIRQLNELPGILSAATEDVVFNLVEEVGNRPFEATFVPAICRGYGKGCSGNDTSALICTLDKVQTRAVLQEAGLPCPSAAVIPVGHAPTASELPTGPYIVKPACADASEGIDAGSVVDRAGEALDKAVRRIHTDFNQPALVEQFVGHRELNVSLLQRGDEVEVLPIAEIDFSAFGRDRPRIVGYSAKWLTESFEYNHTPRIIPAELHADLVQQVRCFALSAWDTLGCRDYVRVDFRLDEQGQLYILEVNANPDVAPDAGFAAALAAADIPYAEFVETVLNNASARSGRRLTSVAASRVKTAKRAADISIRVSRPNDRDAIVALLDETKFFREDELAVAHEVLDESLKQGEQGHYQSWVADRAGLARGWVCFGPTPCTQGTFDVYWLAVSPDEQGRGLGTILMEHAENRIKERGGRAIVVETSGRLSYLPTRWFYLARGYNQAGRMADFYGPGDDKIIYMKYLVGRRYE